MFSEFIMNYSGLSDTKDPVETDPFKLPIEYLDPSDKYVLNDVVAADLELSVSDLSSNTMYHHMMKYKFDLLF
jgi:hypothetical protein